MHALVDLAAQVGATFSNFGSPDAGRLARDTLQKWKVYGGLESHLDAMGDDHYTDVTARVSRQTDTHMKWFIYRHANGVEVWLHEFRRDGEIRKTEKYAASVHNHRYGFASVILKGGYTGECHSVVPIDGVFGCGASVSDEIVKEIRYDVGDAYFMLHDEFHRLRDFASGTATLVVQLPPEVTSSFSVDQRSLTVREHCDVGHDRARMMRAYR